MLVNKDQKQALERRDTPKMSNTTKKDVSDQSSESSSRSLRYSSLVSAFSKKAKRGKKKRPTPLSTPMEVGVNEDGNQPHDPLCFPEIVHDNSPKSAITNFQAIVSHTVDADADGISVLTPLSTGNHSKTSNVYTLETAREKIQHLEHGSNNLKEALRQVLASRRLAEIELGSLRIEVNSLRSEKGELEKQLMEEKDISKSLGLADVSDLRKENSKLKIEIEDLSLKNRSSIQQILEIKTALNSAKDEVESLKVKHSKTEGERCLLYSSKCSLENEYALVIDDMNKLHEEMVKMKDEKVQHSESIVYLQTELSNTQALLISANTELNMTKRKLVEEQSKCNNISKSFGKTELSDLRDQFAEEKKRLIREVAIVKDELRLVKNELQVLEEDKAMKDNQTDQLKLENIRLSSIVESSQEEITLLESQLQQSRKDLESSRIENHGLKLDSNRIKSSSASMESGMKRLRQDIQNMEHKYNSCHDELESVRRALSDMKANELRVQEMVSEHNATIAQIQALREELQMAGAMLDENESMLQKERDDKKSREDYLRKVRQFEGGFNNSESIPHLLAENQIQAALIEELQIQLVQKEEGRRAMLNTLQELRGNIRAIVRVRPFLSNESTSETSIKVLRNNTGLSIVNKINGEQYDFTFDKVLPPSAGQENMFNEVIDYIQSALDGYSICILFYGQTGAGKTFTMQGIGFEEMRGIIPRAIEYINDQKQNLCHNGQWSLSVHASFLEIYNEEIRDLLFGVNKEEPLMDESRGRCFSEDSTMSGLTLSTIGTNNLSPTRSLAPTTPPRSGSRMSRIPSPSKSGNKALSGKSVQSRPKQSSLKARTKTLSPAFKSETSTSPLNDSKTNTNRPKLIIKRDRDGKLHVDGLTTIKIGDDELLTELRRLIDVASKARSVGCTKLNAQSSRSHAIFLLEVTLINGVTGDIQTGRIHFCDLAGNEKVDDITIGSQKKEVQAINKSLSCLGDVFHALGQGASHVPFRNSKLTYLLQDCLSGEGKALMVGNISPNTRSSYESITTLRFVQQANKIELGRAMKNIESKKATRTRA